LIQNTAVYAQKIIAAFHSRKNINFALKSGQNYQKWLSQNCLPRKSDIDNAKNGRNCFETIFITLNPLILTLGPRFQIGDFGKSSGRRLLWYTHT
jgi:hypothetical protein